MYRLPAERYAGNVAGALLPALIAAGITNVQAIREALGMDPGTPIGYRRDGRPIYPIAGGDDHALAEAIRQLASDVKALALERQGGKATTQADIDALVAERLSKMRMPSKAGLIASGQHGSGYAAGQPTTTPHAGLKALLGDGYEPGSFITGIVNARSGDAEQQAIGKASLTGMGLHYADVPENTGKATLGTTDAGGGYVLPNNLVDTVDKPAVGVINWAQFIPFRDGVAVRAVDQPFRTGAPLRLQAQSVWGETKENRDEVYGSYSAPLTTFAAIYDVAKQYLRFSAGAAEQDVMDELTKAARLAEEFSVLAGPGTGTVGTGDATLGIYTSLAATPAWLGYAAAKTGSAASNTVIGSFASACAELVSKLAGRGRIPSVIVTDAVTYWTAVSQGTDEAGFFLSPTSANGGFTIDATGGLSYWGVPVRYSPNFNTFTGTTKAAIAIDGSAFRAYRGMEFRIDSSDVAGSRWDNNLVGFRGEMEMGFNAERGVHVGAAQLMTGVIA